MKGNDHREENGKMNPTLMKILLPIITIAGVGCIVYGISEFQNNKDADVQQAATQIEIQVNDNTIQKTQNEKMVEDALNKQSQQVQQKPQVQQQKPSQTQQVQEQKPVVKEFAVKEVKTQIMYVNATTNSYKGPNSIDFEKVDEFMENDEVTVNGLVNKYGNETVLWYQAENGDFIDGNFLSLDKIQVYTEEPEYVTSDPVVQNNPNIDQIAEDLMREIYGGGGSNGNSGQVHQVPQEVLDALGATPAQVDPTDNVTFGQSELPDYLKGGELE